MQIKPIGHRVRGFYRLAHYALRRGDDRPRRAAPLGDSRLLAPTRHCGHARGLPGQPPHLVRLACQAQSRGRQCGRLGARFDGTDDDSGTDLHSHFAWAWATRSHASAAAQFFRLVHDVFPFAIEALLTDNGSVFQRHFARALADHLFTHWHPIPSRRA